MGKIMLKNIQLKSTRNIIKGKHNKATGKMFEDYIDNTCKWYALNGVAKIEKQMEPMRIIKPLQAGKFVACYSGKAGVDYKGTLKGGKAVVFEAKHTDTEQMKRDRVKPWQLEYMLGHQKLGAEVFVLISFGMANFYRIPLDDWLGMKIKYGRLFLREEDIQDYRLKHNGKLILFLEGVADLEI